jgi:hypothetical protein
MSSPGIGRPEVEPASMSIDDILRWGDGGGLRVPEFRPPFAWTPKMMRELFESIDRGFPIGSLVLWTTDARLPTVNVMGALPLPEPPASGTLTYVLDGHQRLATLYSVLRLPADHPRDHEDGWKWWIYRDLSLDEEEDHSLVYVPDGEPPPHLLPLRSIIRTMDFLTYTKDIEARAERLALEPERMMRRAERLVRHIKSYKLSTLRVTGGTVDEAMTMSARLNPARSLAPVATESEP